VLPYRNHFDLDAPFAPPGFRQPNPSEKRRDHRREITKVFFQLAIEQLTNRFGQFIPVSFPLAVSVPTAGIPLSAGCECNFLDSITL
jgi:hypothetical protein